jgi:uncharacterized protein (TIGR03435 family)
VTDIELLRDYDRHGSEEAFGQLVQRHIDLVYSVALRHIGIAAQAEEITQVVFIILARKAGSLRPDTILEGWLHETTRLTASSFRRGERRRQFREQQAYMQSTFQEPADDAVWHQLAPMLDEALARLGQKDRDAVLLRFFKDKSLREVAAALSISDAAAQRRVLRAVEKLRAFFARRGVVVPASALTTAICSHSIHHAPALLAKSVAAVAAAKGAAASGSVLTLIKGALKIMVWSKVQSAVAVGIAVLLATGTVAVVIEKVVSSTVDESLWAMNAKNLQKAPPVLIIRPARYRDNSALVNNEGKIIAHNDSLVDLLQTAYSFNRQRMILPATVPPNRYDLMLTLRSHKKAALQKAIQKQLGYTARRETRDTDVLLLKVKDPALLAPHISSRLSKIHFKQSRGFWAYTNFPISMEAHFFEGSFNKPVIIDPGAWGNYDLSFQWPNAAAREQAVLNGLAQAGLELIPTNMPIKMLVVEKSDSSTPAAPSFNPNPITLEGTWVGEQVGGEDIGPATLTITGTNLDFQSIDGMNEWCKASFSVQEDTQDGPAGRPYRQEDTNPKQLIARITESPTAKDVGLTANAIYRIEHGTLRIALNEPGDPTVPAAFDARRSRQFVFQMENP